MTAADRCQVGAIITGGLALSTGAPVLWYTTALLLWGAIINLSVEIRAMRRKKHLARPRRTGPALSTGAPTTIAPPPPVVNGVEPTRSPPPAAAVSSRPWSRPT